MSTTSRDAQLPFGVFSMPPGEYTLAEVARYISVAIQTTQDSKRLGRQLQKLRGFEMNGLVLTHRRSAKGVRHILSPVQAHTAGGSAEGLSEKLTAKLHAARERRQRAEAAGELEYARYDFGVEHGLRLALEMLKLERSQP